MRIMWRTSWLAGVFVAAGLMLSAGAQADGNAPVVHVKAVVKDGAVSLQAQADGPFDYTTYRPSANLLVLDLTGVSDGDPAGARVIPSDLVKGYRVQSYSVGSKPVVRVEILLSHGIEPKIEKKDPQNLVLTVSPQTDAIANTPTASSAPVATTRTTVSVEPSAPRTTVHANTAAPKPSIVSASATSADTNARPSFESIRDVKLQENAGGTDVNVTGSGPLNYHVTRLPNPDRLVLDFEGAHLNTVERHIPSNLDPVREIRLAQFTPEVSRVVIDLRGPAEYNVNAAGNKVTVSFAEKAPGAAKAPPAAPDPDLVTTKSAAPARARTETAKARTFIPVPGMALPPGMSRSAALAAPASAPVIAPAAAQPISYAAANPVPAAPPAQQESVAATSVATAASAASAENVAREASPEPVASSPARAVNPVLTVSSAPVEQAPAPAAAPAPRPSQAESSNGSRFTGEPISVNLKDVDLRDFFRLIHEISGLNVVVDPSVKGNLTIVLDDVPWDQALDIVLHNNDLDKQLDGNVLRIATKETLRKEAEENRDLAKAQAEAADVVTTTRVLSYAKAPAMAATLKKFLSSRGDILADDRSNTLIIRDIPSDVAGDRQSDSPTRPQIAASGNRSSRSCLRNAVLLARDRKAVRASPARAGGTQVFVGGTGNVGTSPITATSRRLRSSSVTGGGGADYGQARSLCSQVWDRLARHQRS